MVGAGTEPAPPLAEGRYRLVGMLGAGGMAQVYRGWDARLETWRAIKVLDTRPAHNRKVRERFLNEARIMASLKHPNIVAVQDVGIDQGRPYIVMDLVAGGSLMDHLKVHGPMPQAQAAQAIMQVLHGLQAAHDSGVIHRDIKPQNVLATTAGVLQITDFGIARAKGAHTSALTKTGSVMGTWGFMAPEQRVSARDVDQRSDIYAVGATLYSLLTNKLPVDLFAAALDEQLLGDVDEALRHVVQTATRYKPEERYADTHAMLDALEVALAHLPSAADAPPLGSAGPMAPEVSPPALTPPELSVERPMGELPSLPDESASQTMVPEVGGDTYPISDVVDPDSELGAPAVQPVPDPKRFVPWIALAIALLLLVGVTLRDPPLARAPEAPVDVAPEPVVEPVAKPPEPVVEPVVEPAVEPEPVAQKVPRVQAPVTPIEAPPEVVEAPPEVVEAPPEPEVAPEPPKPGRVSVSGDAERVVLVDASGSKHAPGSVPAGRYEVLADFGNGLFKAGSVNIAEGQGVSINCSGGFATCK